MVTVNFHPPVVVSALFLAAAPVVKTDTRHDECPYCEHSSAVIAHG